MDTEYTLLHLALGRMTNKQVSIQTAPQTVFVSLMCLTSGLCCTVVHSTSPSWMESCRYPIAAACRAAGWLIRQVPLHSRRGSPSCAVEDSPVRGAPFDTLTRGIDEPRFFGNCALHKGSKDLYLRIGMFHGRGMLHGK